jgi:hypothetical protein
VLGLGLAACGGGSSADIASPPPPNAGGGGGTGGGGSGGGGAPVAQSVVLSGVAATGAPMAQAKIKVFDRTGSLVCEQVADDRGAYACDLGTAPKAPFVLVASDDVNELVSAFGEAKSSTVNITPITNMIASTLSPDGDPKTLVSSLAAGNAPAFDAEKLQASVDKILEVLKPLMQALGSTTNPLTGKFDADGAGHDKILDTLRISIRPDGTRANIEITVLVRPQGEDANDEPVKIAFESDRAAPPQLPPPPAAIQELANPGVNIQTMVSEVLAKMNACYALPLAQRVTDGSNPGSLVLDPACKSLFVAGKPEDVLHNGRSVGPKTGVFWSMFSADPGSVKFDRGSLAFMRSNGDWVVSYRIVNSQGGMLWEQFPMRVENGALKLAGNGYQYNAFVRPIISSRDFVTQPEANYVSVGYNLWIENKTDAQGNPVFAKVEVTSPAGNMITLKPTSGLSFLVIEKEGGVLSPTNSIRLQSKFTSATPISGQPYQYETSLVFANAAQGGFTDDAIRQIPDQGVWRMKFYPVDPNAPQVTQNYRTTARVMTVSEAMKVPMLDLTAMARKSIQDSIYNGAINVLGDPSPTSPNHIDLSGDNGEDAWMLPAGALQPNTITVYGRAPTVGQVQGARFNDSVNVYSNAKKALIKCSPQTNQDLHCAPNPYRDQYAKGVTLNTLEFYLTDERQSAQSKQFLTYKLLPPV